MNALKAKAKIHCATCGCSINRTKTIKVNASIKEEAIKEANIKVKKWTESLKKQNCNVCKSIISEMVTS